MVIKKVPCDRHDCFGCMEGNCLVLTDNSFLDRPCPFFKTEDKIDPDVLASIRNVTFSEGGN